MRYIQVKTNPSKGWSTHNGMLIKALLNSTGPVVEVGGGLYSTPLLHWLCKLQGRKLTTYESHDLFYEFCKQFVSRGHTVKFIENWDEMDFKTHYGVVLIDHHPSERRVVDILNFKDSADFIVVHDTERREQYLLDKTNGQFKYEFVWKECVPWTTVYSNFKDISDDSNNGSPRLRRKLSDQKDT